MESSKNQTNKNKGRGRPKGQFTMETWMIANGKKGEYFYSEKRDAHLTSISSHHKRKIITEKMLAVRVGKAPELKKIIKVTLL